MVQTHIPAHLSFSYTIGCEIEKDSMVLFESAGLNGSALRNRFRSPKAINYRNNHFKSGIEIRLVPFINNGMNKDEILFCSH